MSPIITNFDEMELAKAEKLLVTQLKKLARWQKTMGSSQNKFAADIAKMNIDRQKLNRIFRDVFNQMQTIGQEDNSNVGEEEVNMFQEIIHSNDNFVGSYSDNSGTDDSWYKIQTWDGSGSSKFSLTKGFDLFESNKTLYILTGSLMFLTSCSPRNSNSKKLVKYKSFVSFLL